MCFYDAPNEESDTGDGHHSCFKGKQMPSEHSNKRSTGGTVVQIVSMGTYILSMGNQIAGNEMSQKRKKHMKSRVVVPDDSGIEFAG